MTERQWVTAGLFALTALMLAMAWWQPTLWEVKLFEVLMQGVVLTGVLNMVVAFHFAANQQSQKATENTSEFIKVVSQVAARPADAPTGKPGDPVHVHEENQ